MNETRTEPADAGGIKSVKSVFTLLEALAAAGEPRGVTELAKTTGMPKPRVFRHLSTLRTLGYVAKDEDSEKYRLTLKIFGIAQAVADATPFTVVARPAMIALRNATDQTVALSEVSPEGVRILDLLRAHSPVQIVTRPGSLLDPRNSAQGLLACAYGAVPSAGKVDRAHAAELAAIRERGWAVAPERIIAGINALAAPILDVNDRLIGTIAIVGTLATIPMTPRTDQIAAICTAARRISTDLGGTELTAPGTRPAKGD